MLIDRPGRYYQLVIGIPSLFPVGGRYTKFIPRWWQVYTQVVAGIPSLLLSYPFFISTTEQSSLPIVTGNFLWFVCQPELKVYFKFLFTFNVTGE